MEAELKVPPFPFAVGYVWSAWQRLRRRKSQGANGLNPIEWPDIDAFIRRTGVRLDAYDIELLETVDDLFLAKMTEPIGGRDSQQSIRDRLKALGKQKG